MLLEGVVINVANFGAFVDIGVHQDGLVHVSQLADRFVKDPREVESGRHREGQGRRRRPETPPHRPDDEAESAPTGGRRSQAVETSARKPSAGGQSARTPPPDKDKERRAPRCSGDVDGGRVRQDLEARVASCTGALTLSRLCHERHPALPVRHGATTATEEDRFSGSSGAELSEQGRGRPRASANACHNRASPPPIRARSSPRHRTHHRGTLRPRADHPRRTPRDRTRALGGPEAEGRRRALRR